MKNMIKSATIVAVGKLLEQHMKKVGSHGYYEDGYNDERIAQIATRPNAPVNATNVANLRKSMFGNFPPRAASAVPDRVEALECALRESNRRIEALEVWVHAVESRYPKLTASSLQTSGPQI